MSVICIILSILIVIINNFGGTQCTGAYVFALILFIIGAALQANNK